MTKGKKGGRRPFGNRTVANAARVADRRRRRPSRGRGAMTWLRAWPRGANQSGRGNAGRPPSYSAKPYDRTSWKHGSK